MGVKASGGRPSGKENAEAFVVGRLQRGLGMNRGPILVAGGSDMLRLQSLYIVHQPEAASNRKMNTVQDRFGKVSVR